LKTIETTEGRFQVYIGGKRLQKHLSEGSLFAVDQNGAQYIVVSKDIGARLNNWDRMKASILTAAAGNRRGKFVSIEGLGLESLLVQSIQFLVSSNT
jgi:hypothetical protein